VEGVDDCTMASSAEPYEMIMSCFAFSAWSRSFTMLDDRMFEIISELFDALRPSADGELVHHMCSTVISMGRQTSLLSVPVVVL
jgi:hypothetical protein